VKRTFNKLLDWANTNQSTFAEILLASFTASEATNTEIACLFELYKRSCKQLFKGSFDIKMQQLPLIQRLPACLNYTNEAANNYLRRALISKCSNCQC
jgi:hypothetical protein